MSADPYALPPYRVIRFIVAYGTRLAILIGLAPALAGIYLTATGSGPLPALLGVVAGVVLAGVLASYAEVLQVISETLMSQ
jgi:hypothetical protein